MTTPAPTLDTIFLAAIEIDSAPERAAYIARACEGDIELRGRVEKLVLAHFRAGNFLEWPAAPPFGTGAYTPAAAETPVPGGWTAIPEGPGTHVGPYQLVQEIGTGGMGAVFLAQQTQPVQRQVALKIIKPGMDSRQIIARFEAERQALALMDHPHIAKVLDAGTTGSDRPYFVMELVTGVPITRYCDEHRLTPKQRLELFLPVCQAVQHAHQKGIVHRDLKPANVLVCLYDGRPVPKVIDFGIAKATGPHLTDQTTCTQVGQIVGTLEYMSPEQAEVNQHDIDTRSDIYSLGVLLYELLTSTTPLELKRLKEIPFLEVLRRIRDEEAPQPSTRLSNTDQLPSIAAARGLEPKRLGRQVRGELDWIVMKCLEKDRTRRYETANALAADVQRYLRHEPVEAGPPSGLYRLRKFVRRHRGAALAAGLVVMALLAGVAASTWQAWRATQAEVQARKSAETARAINQFLIEGMLSAATPEEAQGRKVTVEEVLDKAAGKIDGAFPDQPEVEAGVRLAIGKAYQSLSLYPKADPHLRRALELRLRLLGADHADTLEAMSEVGSLCAKQGKYDEAERHQRQVLEGFQRIHGKEHPRTLEAMYDLAWVLSERKPVDKAEPLFRECLAGRIRVLGEEHPDTLETMGKLAQAITHQGWSREAEPLARRCLELTLRVRGENHPETVDARMTLARALQRTGKWLEAEPLFRENLAAARRIFGPDHREALGNLEDLGMVHLDLGRFSDAEQELRQCRDGFSQVVGADHPATLNDSSRHALALLACGRLEEAEQRARYSYDTCRRVRGPEDHATWAQLARLGKALRVCGQWTEAEGCLQQVAEDLRRAQSPEDQGFLLQVMREQATVLLALGRREEARTLFWQVLDGQRPLLPPDHPNLAETLYRCGEYLLEIGESQQAEPLLKEALRIQRLALPPEHFATGQTLAALGWVRTCAGDAAEGEQLLREGLTIVRTALPENHWFPADAESRLGSCLTTLKRFDEAEPLLRGGYDKLMAAPGTPPARRTQALEGLVQLYEGWGQSEKAAEWRRKLEAEKKRETKPGR